MSFLSPKPATSTVSSTSQNANNALITSAFSPSISAGTNAISALGDQLGGGYDNYLQMAGYQPAMTQLSRNITGQAAASGLLNSGATAQALQTKGTALNQQYYNNYLQQLTGLAGLGLQAGGLVTNAGQTSSSTGGSTGASPSQASSIASGVGSILGLFSDRRLKTDVQLVRRDADGLGWYDFRYIGNVARMFGVMADEVARLRPWALGCRVAGYATVNYGAL